MEYRQFVNDQVSAIGLGTWAMGSSPYGASPKEQSIDCIRAALDAGITVFDSSPAYGDSESILGEGLGAQRHDVFISTKFGRSPDLPGPDFSASCAKHLVEQSLKRLQVDKIDVLFVHSPFSAAEINEDMWEGLLQLKQEGKIKYIGHSISKFEDTEGLARQWAADGMLDAVQTVVNALNHESLSLIKDMQGQGVAVIARECLANGFLTGAVTREHGFGEGSRLNNIFPEDTRLARLDQIEKIQFLIDGNITNLAQAAMRWAMDQAGVTLALSGAKQKEHLQEAIDAVAAGPYAQAVLDEVLQAHTENFAAI